ncbi:MAG: hypothetical protein QOJ79_2193, partial [Actinomycetota bacterium]|nr:hypothetical protein [Actinomycetota bacterium]
VTKRASVGSHGEQGDGVSLFGILAHSGRQIVMASGASTFDDNPQPAKPCVRAAGDVGKGAPCGKIGMYLRDGVDRTTTNEYPSQNVDVAGTDKASLAIPGSMSADGRYLAFWATVQVPTPGVADERHSPYRFEVFRHDTKTGQNDRVSVAYKCDCDATDASSGRAEISADGRYVAFTSWASNIVPHDTNKVRDVFVRDMVTHVTTRVDVPSYRDRDLGEPNNAETKDKTRQDNENGDTGADLFSISRDGRYVVFKSSSSNLVRNDNNNVADVFVRDRVARTTIRVNVSSRGEQANHQTKSVLGLGLHTISDDGRYVFFNSNASNLVSPPTQDYLENVYRRDLRRGITTLVTVSSDGKRADSDVALDPERVAFTYLAPLLVAGGRDVGLSGLSYSATPDGRYIVFNSDATNLVPGDDNNVTDIFLRDLATRTTTRVSVTSGGEQTKAGHCGTPGLSDDARFVVFDCGAEAEDLVPEDTNKSGDVFVRELPGARPLTGWY